MNKYNIAPADLAKLEALDNPKVMKVVKDAIDLMKPEKVIVITDDPEEIEDFRQKTIDLVHEERRLAIEGHTVHYDGYYDQARDKTHTAVLLPEGQTLSRGLVSKERKTGLNEIYEIMDGIMAHKIMCIRFYCLGPTNSRFSIPTLQITDSFYVAHSEDLLYRPGYEQFKQMEDKEDFFYFYHSAGQVDHRGTSVNIEKRRIYIDPLEYRVFSANNQYAGNSLACKKLALRLAIWRSNNIPEDQIPQTLTEHMFISAFYPLDESKQRKTYFAGAYPSACGKTSTAMISGTTIVGDDIAYLGADDEGYLRGVNIEQGIFGIIKDVNPKDDPVIYNALTTPKELIFSNVLTTKSGKPYWLGMGKDVNYPDEGYNHAGYWHRGDRDKEGNEIDLCHSNARYTLRIEELENADEKLHDPEGVKIDGILYGGRDSDITVPVAESLSWEHGVFIGATIESETTSATLGEVGVRKSSPMANMDFIIVPLGKYFDNHIKFGQNLDHCPKVYATNYFLKNEEGKYLNTKLDKKVWLLWAEGRIHNEFEGIRTPIGILPKYEDLKDLFAQVFDGRLYTEQEYIEQFTIRVKEYLLKYNRMEELFQQEPDLPEALWDELQRVRSELENLQQKFNKDKISPLEL